MRKSDGKKCLKNVVDMDKKGEVFRPKIVITTSRRKSNLTNTFIKTLARALGVPIIRRGSSNLDEIAYNVMNYGYEGFIVVYTMRGNPSALTFFKMTDEGYFRLFGRIFILGVKINRLFKGAFDGIKLIYEGNEEYSKEAYEFLREYFLPWKVQNQEKNFCKISIKDLEVFRENWLKESEKFRPAEIIFHSNRGVEILRIKVHHTWKAK